MPTSALHPQLQAILAAGGLDPDHFDLGFPLDPAARPPRSDLFLIGRTDQTVMWNVPSLASLLRGNGVPPDLKDYPPAWVPIFAFIEQRVWSSSRYGRAPTDGELEEVYSNLRRRPDGRSTGATHDAVWQIAALTLGTFPMSAAELDAVFQRLSKSARNWKESATSRNYLAGLARMFDRG